MDKKCSECEHLDKSRKQSYSKAYRYGCKLRQDGYVSTWINTDTYLSQISCSTDDAEEDEIDLSKVTLDSQMTIDEWLGV